MNKLHLNQYENVITKKYSGGNKRKLSVAIALIGRPPIIFLDEPSSGMDPQTRRFMWKVISDVSIRHKFSTIVLTTHRMDEAEALAQKVAIMVNGYIKAIGSLQKLKDKYGKGYELDIKL